MEPRVVLLLNLFVLGVTGKADHAELRGEHPSQEDIDNGECIPIPCVLGAPPPECKKLCDLRHYDTICQPPAEFCLCRHMVHGKMTLVSPDEVMDQPPDSSEVIDRSPEMPKVTQQEEPLKALKTDQQQELSAIVHRPLAPTKVVDQLQGSDIDQPQEQSETDDDGVVSFQIYAIFLPIKQFFYETDDEGSTPEPTADPMAIGYESVNVHEGRLFWDFRYILTGLLLLMIGLVVYELVMCAMQVYGPKREFSVKCEEPEEVKVKPVFTEQEKVLNV